MMTTHDNYGITPEIAEALRANTETVPTRLLAELAQTSGAVINDLRARINDLEPRLRDAKNDALVETTRIASLVTRTDQANERARLAMREAAAERIRADQLQAQLSELRHANRTRRAVGVMR